MNLAGKTFLVTGANTGIGYGTALGLAELGATVIMVCRSPQRGQQARDEIIRASGNDAVHLLITDLSSQADIRKLAQEIRMQFDHLHCLINNAAVIPAQREITVDRLEMQFAVNHLAPFLLTHLLLDLLHTSAPARIVTVSSNVHHGAQLDFDDLQSEHSYERVRAYNQSKLANVLFTMELARRLAGSGVTANALHPGVIATNVLDDYTGRPRSNQRDVADWRRGARTSIYLATSPDVEGISGRYFADERETNASELAQDEGLARRLWDISTELTSINPE